MKKRILALMITCAVLVPMFANSAFAAEKVVTEDLEQTVRHSADSGSSIQWYGTDSNLIASVTTDNDYKIKATSQANYKHRADSTIHPWDIDSIDTTATINWWNGVYYATKSVHVTTDDDDYNSATVYKTPVSDRTYWGTTEHHYDTPHGGFHPDVKMNNKGMGSVSL